MNQASLLWLLLTAAILSGCSATSLVYNNAPWLLREKVDDYFSLSSVQEKHLEQDIELLFEWHRYQELPEYANLISTINRQIADGVTREELSWVFEQVAAARVRFVEASLQGASEFLATIDDEQLQRFDTEFGLKLAEDRERLDLSVEEQKEERYERVLETMEEWFGDFNGRQQSALRLIIDDRPLTYAQWLDRREQRHRDLIDFLADKPEAPAIKVFLHRQYVQSIKQKTDTLRNDSRRFWLLAGLEIDRIITPQQRRHAMLRLDSYKEDFSELSRQKAGEIQVVVEP